MDDFPAKVSTRTSTPAEAPGYGRSSLPGLRSLALDLGFLRSFFGLLMVAEVVLGLLVWALIASTSYQPIPAYGWVMFVAIFFWLVTIILFVMYLLQLNTKLYMVPWPIVLMIFNAAATVLYVTAFITCSAAVQSAYWLISDYNKRAAASFFACILMIAYGASTFLSFQVWKGCGSNAATSQATN
ncbi:plasmolipin [Emydura macquarii macquarii]|uniref:plasmolipin n=1 Tax=Emydura macquarii macquarii TaxID=1129001 RepID=UPI00352AF2C4